MRGTRHKKFHCKNPEKYKGDPSNIISRSSWEAKTFAWLDYNDKIEWWQSEEFFIPYVSALDNKTHRYFVDLTIKFKGVDEVYIIEIKPLWQTLPPVNRRRKNSTLVRESREFIKNQSKWKYANEYAISKGMIFRIWTEVELRKLGILPAQIKRKN